MTPRFPQIRFSLNYLQHGLILRGDDLHKDWHLYSGHGKNKRFPPRIYARSPSQILNDNDNNIATRNLIVWARFCRRLAALIYVVADGISPSPSVFGQTLYFPPA